MIILDLDNTIANDGWRIKKINWKQNDPFLRYHDYHSLSAFDAVGNADLFKNKHEIIVLTARPVFYRSITEEWLRRVGVDVMFLLMRNNGDHTHSRELKREQLHSLFTHYGVKKTDIFCAYDDREDVVQMYREEGIVSQRRWIHEVCSYTKPIGEIA